MLRSSKKICNSGESLAKGRKTRLAGLEGPDNEARNVKKRKLENENGNLSSIRGETAKKVKESGSTGPSKQKKIFNTVSARFKENDQIVDTDVGQDNKFLSEDSDEESNIVVLKNVAEPASVNEQSTDEDTEEEEDGELREILNKNYKIAGLQEESQGAREAQDVLSQKELILDEAVSKFEEVLQKSGFIETASQMQKQLIESQQTVQSQAKELGRLTKYDRSRRDNAGKVVNNNTSRALKINGEKTKRINDIISRASDYELTVYKNAVENQISKRDSSSSEDVLNSSDEIMVIDTNANDTIGHSSQLIDQFIADTHRAEADKDGRFAHEQDRRSAVRDEAATSQHRRDNR